MKNQPVKTSSWTFYLCPVCFQASDHPLHCHGHQMVLCDPGAPGDDRRKPVTDSHGRMLSPAPRWFLEATGAIRSAGNTVFAQ